MDYKDDLMISGIQHFVYCERQWALIHVEDQWVEDASTASGRLMHKRVHDPEVHDVRNGIITKRGVSIGSKLYGITGVCDAVEFIPDDSGIEIVGHVGKWRVRPVEYKRGSSKQGDEDRLQLTAQALCLEEMIGCHIDDACLFYGQTRHRENVRISEKLREKTIQVISEMREIYESGVTPRGQYDSRCLRCSLKNVCMPELFASENSSNVQHFISKHIQEVRKE